MLLRWVGPGAAGSGYVFDAADPVTEARGLAAPAADSAAWAWPNWPSGAGW